MVRPRPGHAAQGLVAFDGRVVACALGRTGITALKREGDWATPVGRFSPLAVLFRADRVGPPSGDLPLRAIRADDGWADDAGSAQYNCHVRLPFAPSHESLIRDDHLYDVVVITDHNRAPRIRGFGSAVFLHCAREGLAPTAGCVALPHDVWRRLGHRLLIDRPVLVATSGRPVRRTKTARPFFRGRRSAI
ncbi:L,D-transpeptidase family protein [Amorphus coralli]|uniref:L,D-transpeptidase family protein n=1 Tax=Amorphus coralli TaxID=340680 RepID=UPI00037E6738|nr:L,D-transpeptidase family protein [Amorphus coralli]